MESMKIRPGTKRSHARSPNRQLIKVAKRLRRSAIRHQFGRGCVVPRSRGPRVIVKVSSVRNRGSAKLLASHLRYLARESSAASGGRQNRPEFYNADGLTDDAERKSFLKLGARSRHHFRWILSPEHPEDLDLTEFTQAVMRQVESDVGARLRWLATNHHDTDHPHVHVVILGVVSDGQDLVLRRDYLINGLRQRAITIAEFLRETNRGVDSTIRLSQVQEKVFGATRSVSDPPRRIQKGSIGPH